jgi:hypothetical protein
MTMKRLLAVMTLAALASAGSAGAQELRELGNQGYRNGVSSFGGYYESFGGMGGNNTYSGYQRYKGSFAPTTSIIAIPLQAPTQTGAPPCSYLKSRADQTRSKVWRARYQACKNGN